MDTVTISHRALIFSEGSRLDGVPVLLASTGGGVAELTAADARRVGAELIRWADEQAPNGAGAR